MTGTLVALHTDKRDFSHALRLDKGVRDALADHLRLRWPTHTAKHAAREYDLTLDRAREAVAGRASLTTVERIIKRGGFAVALPLIEAITGQSLASHFRDMRAAHEENGRRLAAMFGADPVGSAVPDRVAGGGSRLGDDVGGDAARRTGSR